MEGSLLLWKRFETDCKHNKLASAHKSPHLRGNASAESSLPSPSLALQQRIRLPCHTRRQCVPIDIIAGPHLSLDRYRTSPLSRHFERQMLGESSSRQPSSSTHSEPVRLYLASTFVENGYLHHRSEPADPVGAAAPCTGCATPQLRAAT